MLDVFIEAVGLAAPGLPNWRESVPILTGQQAYIASALGSYRPTQLPANEARRATQLIRLGFRAAEDLMSSSTVVMRDCATVFASSGGDYPIVDQVCRSLSEPERLISPTQFHNSVHNAAAGYWSIATGSRYPSTSLSAYDESFGAGLLEAICLCRSEQLPTLLVVYDVMPPYPLSEKRSIANDFSVAFLLSPMHTEQSLARVSMSMSGASVASACQSQPLESLRLSNPAARSLPLLEMLARQSTGNLAFELPNQNGVQLEINSCC